MFKISNRFLTVTRNWNKGAQNEYRRSIKKLTHAKPVPSSSGRKVRTRSGLYVKQQEIEHYYGMEHEWKDKRKFKERVFKVFWQSLLGSK